MAERRISENSLENLRKTNKESNLLTREAIETALLQLLEKKELTKISISELVQRAGVSRAAFYRNYESKEAILESVFKRSVHNIMEQLSHYDVKTDLYLVWVHLFRKARKEAKVIQLALDYHLEKIFVQAMQEFLEKYYGKSKGVSSYLHSFWSSAIVSVLLKWIKDGMKFLLVFLFAARVDEDTISYFHQPSRELPPFVILAAAEVGFDKCFLSNIVSFSTIAAA